MASDAFSMVRNPIDTPGTPKPRAAPQRVTATTPRRRIHVFGASGSGTTTLGGVLAGRLDALHLDADAYYWIETDPPFIEKRPAGDRVAAIERDIGTAARWVLSGSLCGWGDALVPQFDLAVFLFLDPTTRLARLRARERRRFGGRIDPGGDMHAQHLEFMAWAAGYDHGRAPRRSLDLHERWMQRLDCPILRLDARAGPQRLADQVLEP